MDTAVEIAKESADLILLENDLMVLEGGAIEGRKELANILRYIRMGASSNFGNIFSVLGASAGADAGNLPRQGCLAHLSRPDQGHRRLALERLLDCLCH